MHIISASIDISKIDESKIYIGKNGRKWVSVSILVKDEIDQYNNSVAISLGQTPQEIKAKSPKVYLGNGKIVFDNSGNLPVSSREDSLFF